MPCIQLTPRHGMAHPETIFEAAFENQRGRTTTPKRQANIIWLGA